MDESKLYSAVYDNLMLLMESEKLSPKQLEENIENLIQIFSQAYPSEKVDKEQIFREVTNDYEVYSGYSSILKNNDDHHEWLANEKSDIKWDYWKRYKKYISSVEKLPPKVVEDLNETTDNILKLLESPNRSGNWDRRGMVVGNVQSGKTSNYTGLICKAVDAGYKVIVVLAGLSNDLRSQTQKRIDKGFYGIDTQKRDDYDQRSLEIGAGKFKNYPVKRVHALTHSGLNGDFKKSVYNGATIVPGGDPVFVVVKKNVTPLKNLYNWFSSQNNQGIIKDVPLLLIDDEADNASIDTRGAKKLGISNLDDIKELDPTKINGYIRKILNCFTQSAYIGYTATPFANIFIYPSNPELSENEFGEDLFPKSFIVNLHAPSNYVGPETVFGLYKDQYAHTEETNPLPITRVINDYSSAFPENHKKDLVVCTLPDSMIKAIYSFILSCAARISRGQDKKHCSMLVHTTRFVDVQMQIVELIKVRMKNISNQLEMKTGPQYDELMKQLKILWEKDFVETTNEVIKVWGVNDKLLTKLTWKDIKNNLYKCASKIEVKAINGKAVDGGLNYDQYPNGAYVIAVGGDKLSRGLTLEGLITSYYTRASKMYDTLLQMGRWFGYKNGFVDLCRLYTTSELIDWYQHIAVANIELKREFDIMAESGATPRDFGLKVRTHPDGLLITALNKMKNSEEATVTYSGLLAQTTRFYRNSFENVENYKQTEKWILDLGEPEYPSKNTRNNYIWRNRTAKEILDFLSFIKVHNSCFTSNPKILSDYISNLVENGELCNWTIELVNSGGGEQIRFANLELEMPWRTNGNCDDKEIVSLIKKNLISETDQDVDLTESEKRKAMEDTIKNWKPRKNNDVPPTKPSPVWIRKNRDPKKGLLIIYVFNSGEKGKNDVVNKYPDKYIGFALSFPESKKLRPVTYKVDDTFVRNWEDDDSE